MNDQQQTRTGGIESKMEGVGLFYLILSIIAMIGLFVLSQDEGIKATGRSGFWVAIGIAAAAQGIVFLILFKAGAEVIRLLKKLNGIPYGGKISETYGSGVQYTCKECGTPVAPDAIFCTNCGANFEDESEDKE